MGGQNEPKAMTIATYGIQWVPVNSRNPRLQNGGKEMIRSKYVTSRKILGMAKAEEEFSEKEVNLGRSLVRLNFHHISFSKRISLLSN